MGASTLVSLEEYQSTSYDPDCDYVNGELEVRPFLCVEVLWPEDRANRIERKIVDYLKFGVRYIWVIDPRTREAFTHTATGMHAVEDGILRTSDPDIAEPRAEILG